LLEHFKLTAFYYISIELNEKSVPHLHIILGLKSIIGYNDIIHKNIKKFFLDINYLDVKIQFLENFLDVKNCFNYALKDIHDCEIIKSIHHMFCIYYRVFKHVYNLMSEEIMLQNIPIDIGLSIIDYDKIPSIKQQTNNYSEFTIINLINFFIIVKNYC